MSLFTARHPRRALLAAALAAGVLLGGPLAVNTAHAAIGCRADPLVHLTNGTTIDVSATIYDTAADVKGITYVLHGPTGTAFSTVTWPAWDQFTARETFRYVADQAPGQYRTDTLVQTGSAAQVTAYTDVSDQDMYAASGVSGQVISVHGVDSQY